MMSTGTNALEQILKGRIKKNLKVLVLIIKL
jgi:hypothetical protein